MRLFILLQVLDIATTLGGFALGAGEASPFVRLLVTSVHPVVALLAVKLAALIAAAYWYDAGRSFVKFNAWFGAVVLWNCIQIGRIVCSM